MTARPETLLPHRPPMLFVEEIRGRSPDSAQCLVTVKSIEPSGSDLIPATYALEYIAQTAGIIGPESPLGGKGPQGGMVVSVRDFRAYTDHLVVGQRLVVTARLEGRSAQVSIYSGEVHTEGTGDILASGGVTLVFTEGDI